MTVEQTPQEESTHQISPDFWPEVHMIVPTIDPERVDPETLGIATDKWQTLTEDQKTAVAAVIGVDKFHQETDSSQVPTRYQ